MSSRDALGVEDIAVGVFTSALNLRERALSVQETWLRDFPNAYLIGGWYGDPGLRMITLGEGVGEDYRSAHRKQFLGLMELRKRFSGAKWFFITGCDAYVFAGNLVDLLSEFDHRGEFLVGGHCGEAAIGEERFLFPSGGPGFAVSAGLAAAIAPRVPGFVEEWERGQGELASACDVALAYLVLRERGVRVTFREGFYFLPPYRYPGNAYKDGEGRLVDRQAIEKPLAYHSLSIREMYLLDSGRRLRRPGPAALLFDATAKLAGRKLRSKSIVNRASRFLFGRGAMRRRDAHT